MTQQTQGGDAPRARPRGCCRRVSAAAHAAGSVLTLKTASTDARVNLPRQCRAAALPPTRLRSLRRCSRRRAQHARKRTALVALASFVSAVVRTYYAAAQGRPPAAAAEKAEGAKLSPPLARPPCSYQHDARADLLCAARPRLRGARVLRRRRRQVRQQGGDLP